MARQKQENDQEALEFFAAARKEFTALGALPPQAAGLQIKAAYVLVKNGVTIDTVQKIIRAGVHDPWHGPKLLDEQLLYVRRCFYQLKSLVSDTTQKPTRTFKSAAEV